jgi:phage baseplate assembly protein W
MAIVTYKDSKQTTRSQKNQVFSGFSTQGRTFQDPKLYDIELVKQDLLNHFNIRKGEKLENPEFGTNIWLYVFDPLDQDTKNSIIQEVEDVCAYDPRVDLDQIEVDEYEHGIQIRVSLLYIGYGIGETIDLLFDNQQGLLTGQQTFYPVNTTN